SRNTCKMAFFVAWIGNAFAAAGTKRVHEFSESTRNRPFSPRLAGKRRTRANPTSRGAPALRQSRPTLRRDRDGCPDVSGGVAVRVATSREVLDPDPGADERIERVLVPFQRDSG